MKFKVKLHTKKLSPKTKAAAEKAIAEEYNRRADMILYRLNNPGSQN